ncbi:MAG: trimeric intracellular cation channel family protein [Anaerolineaceae bacterium]|nr:trimeric intracellular cation channel family protein [Anaerolineaceae bacterium]
MLFLFELFGSVAFAISGALVAIDKKMDIFGVSFLSMTTAVGGGILRDVILNITPPAAFREPIFMIVSLLAGVCVFFFAKYHINPLAKPKWLLLLQVMDSIGLAIFTVMGVQTAYTQAINQTVYSVVFVGAMSGIGGGVLRDILAGDTPVVLVEQFYACASILGAIVCALAWPFCSNFAAMLIGAATIIVLRFLAVYYHWNLPKVI